MSISISLCTHTNTYVYTYMHMISHSISFSIFLRTFIQVHIHIYLCIYSHISICTYLYEGFLKWRYPQIINFSRIFHYKPTIFEVPHLWNPPAQGQKDQRPRSRHRRAPPRRCHRLPLRPSALGSLGTTVNPMVHGGSWWYIDRYLQGAWRWI